MSRGSISIFIPAYNAESTIGPVVSRIEPALWDLINMVYIIDDGSTDKTAGIIDAIAAKNSRCRALHKRANSGYGATVKSGLALCRSDGCKHAVCLHADGQYPPERIGEFVDTMTHRNMDLLQGSRIASGGALRGGMPLYKYVAGKLLCMVENMAFGLSLTDYHSGFLVYGRRLLDALDFGRLSDSFDFDLEVIASARASGFAVDELPIPAFYGDEKSYLNPVTYGMRVACVVAGYCAGRYRDICGVNGDRSAKE